MGVVNRFVASACLLLIATACGATTSVSNGQSGALAAKEWCAQYGEIMTGIRPDQEPPAVDGPEFRAILDKLRGLADRAPAEIRDDLRAMWSAPDDLLNSPAPPGPQTTPDIPDQLPEQAMRPFRWINDHCADAAPPTGPSGIDAIPPDFPDNRPVGDWQVAQRGTVGKSTWTFFRTGASDGGICVAFEADPSYMDGEARIRAQAPAGTPFPPLAPPGLSAPPGVPLPPGIPSAPPGIPLPPVPPDLGITYQGKLPQCGPAPDRFQRSDPVMFWVTDQDPTNHYNVLAGLVIPETRSLTVTFQEGTQQVVQPVDGTFVLTYDPKLHVAKVVPDLGPGSKVTCGPLPNEGLPAGIPAFLSMGCNGSVSRTAPPVPAVGQPKG